MKVLGAPRAYALAVATGVLVALTFPFFDFWPVAFVALVPLLVALDAVTPRRAAGLGWVAGFVTMAVGFYWLFPTLRVFGGFPAPLCALVMALICGYQAGRTALCGFLFGLATRRGWPRAPVFALAFAATELVFPLLFPWYLGVGVHGVPVLLQLADVGGPILVGLVLVAANLALAELVLARMGRRRADRRVLAAGLAAPAVALLYGAVRLSTTGAAMRAAEPITIGIVQANTPLLDRKGATAVHLRRTKELKERGVGLAVWSELAIASTFYESSYESDVERDVTKSLGLPAVVGATLYRKDEDKALFYNSALLTGDDGRVLGRYDKQYLLPFGEYLPFGDTFPILYTWSPNSSHYMAGTSLEPLVWNGHRISVLICYEDLMPAFVNRAVRHADPDLLVNMTNDAWFGDTNEPWGHLALSKFRAVEHRRYLVRATNSGMSAIIDATGRVVAQGGTFREETIVGEARFLHQRTVYEILGDIPFWVAAAAIGFMGARRRSRKEGAPREDADGRGPGADSPDPS